MNPIMITEVEHLNKARSLLHNCYLEHLEWEIIHSNPSGINVQKQSNWNIISDDYDELAVWFSVLNDENECVACGRLCHKDSNGLLEIERYPHVRKLLKDILEKKHEFNILELNREAILPKYAENPIPYLLLLKLIFQYCLNKNHSILTTSNLSQWVTMYDQLGFKRLNISFKYFDSEPEPVVVYFAQKFDIVKMLEKINFLL